MRKLLHLFFLFATAVSAWAQNKDYPIQVVPFTSVKLTDNFWLPRIKINHTVTIPASFERCESTGRVKNFEMAAARSGKFCTVYPFDDTDIYKTIEGASFSLSLYPDKKLEDYIDTLITKIKSAQEPDGYLYTARTINPNEPHLWSGNERWEKEREQSHELYNSGHLYEAAAAHYQATGKRNLLDIALKNADLVCSVFGPDRKHVAPGHEVIEMGLVKLYRITGKREYLETAKYFIEERGHYNGYDTKSTDPYKNGAYWQDHIPVVEQKEAVGHAVRAGYLYAAVADIAALTAKYLIVDSRPSQSAYALTDHLAHADPVVQRFEAWARRHLADRFSLDAAASCWNSKRRARRSCPLPSAGTNTRKSCRRAVARTIAGPVAIWRRSARSRSRSAVRVRTRSSPPWPRPCGSVTTWKTRRSHGHLRMARA